MFILKSLINNYLHKRRIASVV